MTKGGEVLKNNYTVSSRKRFLFYILMILSLLCIIALQFFGQNERDGNTKGYDDYPDQTAGRLS